MKKARNAMRNPWTKGSDGNAELETICQPYRFFSGVLYYPTCAVRSLFLCTDWACDAVSEKVFSERTFLRGMLWALFFIILFLGKLKLFYENEAVLKATWMITAVTTSWLWVDHIYMAGILVVAVCIFGKRLRLRGAVAGMEKVMFGNIGIYITDMNITPFTVGLLKPKIVLPKIMADSYNGTELKVIIQHEQTHIQLGHLWFGFVWDILRCLLWINPFLTVFQKHFRADMEDICDRVCIQNSGKEVHEYGLVLLKSLKLLRSGMEDVPPAATYVGEKEFADMKREAFEDFLEENNAEWEIWIVFGGFYKLPGLAGVAESCTYENNSEDEVVRIPYESIMDDWYFGLLKML